MSYHLKVIRDNPIGFWTLDESSGSTAIDISGCSNDGSYIGSLSSDILPLVPGGQSASIITDEDYIEFPIVNDYYGSSANGGIADKNSIDNDFSLEVWFKPNIFSEGLVPIFADADSECGIYYKEGNVLFTFGGQTVSYTLPVISRVHYIVATYSIGGISLYCNSEKVAHKDIDDIIVLENTGLTLSSGPTNDASDSFLIDAPAVYRYAISEKQIISHMVSSQSQRPIQIVNPDEGILFSLSSANIKESFFYSYPTSKTLESLVVDGIMYDNVNKCLAMQKTETAESGQVIVYDQTRVPSQLGIATSKIEWEGSNGISVYTSIDNETYVECINGYPVPQFNKSSFSEAGILYIKIIFTSSDLTEFIPKLGLFNISFYRDISLFADNYGDKVYDLDSEYSLGRKNYDILTQHYNNGLRTDSDSSFKIDLSIDVSTIEFFFTPESFASAGSLIESDNTEISWASNGAISKTNIDSLYVNGVDVTNQSNISSIFRPGYMSHVLIILVEPTTGDLVFAPSQKALYKNLSVYSEQFDAGKAVWHYELYVSRPSVSADDSSFTVTELDTLVHNENWDVIKSQ